MRALHLACLALCCLALTTCAPTPPAPEPGPALWRIADRDSEIWLFGTVHVLPANVAWRTGRIDAAFAAADELITEADVGPEGEVRFTALAMRYGVLPEGARLDQLLTAEQSAQLARLAAAQRDDPNLYVRLRPWLAALRLSVGYATARGHTSENGVETVLSAEAAARGMRVSYLESAERQIRALAEMSRGDQLRFLIVTMQQIEEEPDQLEELDAVWARGDTVTLARLIADDMAETPGLYDALLTQRNRAWTDEIARRLNGSGDVFIAVGAAHLVGPDSVVAMLRARGIEVEGPSSESPT